MTRPNPLTGSPTRFSTQVQLKRLLVVTDCLPTTEADSRGGWLLDLLEILRDRGVEVEVFSGAATRSGQLGDFTCFGFTTTQSLVTFNSSCAPGPASAIKVRDYLKIGELSLAEHLGHHQYDHILALGAFPSGCIVRCAVANRNQPFSTWSLGPDIHVWEKKLLFGRLVRQTLRQASFLFADGDKLADRITSISGRECHFLPSFRRFHYKMLPTKREKFFLYVGALEKSRGVFDLLRAFARIKKDIWDYRLILVGSGSEEDRVKKKISGLKLRGKVHLLGEVPNEELINYLQRARALVIPSQFDSIPLVFGEALQANTPLVVTEVGDLGTLVRDNKLGFVARRRSPASLADAMVRMMMADLDIRSSARNLIDRLAPERAAETLTSILTGPDTLEAEPNSF